MSASWPLGQAPDGGAYHLPDRAIDQGLLVCSSDPSLREAILARALRCRLDAHDRLPHPKQVHVLAHQPADARAVPVDPGPYAQDSKSLPWLATRADTLFIPDMAAAADPHWSLIAHMVVTGHLALAAAAAPEHLRELSTDHLNIWSAFGAVILTTLSPVAEETLEFLFGPVTDGAMLLRQDQCRLRPGWGQAPITLTIDPALTRLTPHQHPETPADPGI